MKYRSCDHSALKAYFHFSPRSLWKEFQHFAMISSLTYPTIAFAVDLFVMNPIHGPLMIGSMDRIGDPPLASIPQLVPNEDTILSLFLSLQEQCNKDKMCLDLNLSESGFPRLERLEAVNKSATRIPFLFFKQIRLLCKNIPAISVACFMSEC